MKTINELAPLIIELLDNINDDPTAIDGIAFTDRAVEIINEIADFAEKTNYYKTNLECIQSVLADKSAFIIYNLLVRRISEALIFACKDNRVILLMPFLRRALNAERSEK